MTRATDNPRPALERLRRATRVLITGHRSPDGDCLGGALGLAELARALDVEAVVVNRDPAPAGLGELPGADAVLVRDTLPEDFPAAYDLVCTVECPGLDRTGFDGLHRLPILNLDHHHDNACFGEVNYLDEDAPAAGEMIWRMYTAAPVTPSADAATNLYVALTTDTGDFRYSNTGPRALRAAAEMVEWGASPVRVAEWVHHRRSPSSLRLLGEALRRLEVSADGRVADISVDADAFRAAGATPADTDDLVNHPRAIAGVRVAVLFKQWEPGVVRVSLRSKGAVDVQSVAAAYGGGGHLNAAGCTVAGELEPVRQAVLERVHAALEVSS